MMNATLLAALTLSLLSISTSFTLNLRNAAFMCTSKNCCTKKIRKRSKLFSDIMDSAPSDYDSEDLASREMTVSVDKNKEDEVIRDELKRELIVMASVTNRGVCASNEEKDLMIDIVTQLEALNPTSNPGMNCEGDWELCLSNTHLFLSSPFFMAVRAAIGDDNKDIAITGFDIHARATRAGRIGRVRQTVTQSEVTSEVALDVGVLPGIPLSLLGTIETKADVKQISAAEWELSVKRTKTKGSNIPFLNQYIDDLPLELPFDQIYAISGGDVPKVILRTFYVDEGMRIVRDIDDNFFVFIRA